MLQLPDFSNVKHFFYPDRKIGITWVRVAGTRAEIPLLLFNFVLYKTTPMTYISIDTKTKQAKKFVELLETLPFAKILQEPNAITKKAMDDTRKNKTTKHKNSKELIAFLNK